MPRTTIYLSQWQVDTLRALSRQRGQPMAALVREAIGGWLDLQTAAARHDEPTARMDEMLDRRRSIARRSGIEADEVDHDVHRAVAQVRKSRRARGG